MTRIIYSWLYPELAQFPTKEGRRIGEQRIEHLLSRTGRSWIGSLFIFLFVVVSLRPLHPIGTGHWVVVLLAKWAVLWLVFYAARIVFTSRSEVRRDLRVCLRGQGIPICIFCGYNLTGLQSPCCPECGVPFRSD